MCNVHTALLLAEHKFADLCNKVNDQFSFFSPKEIPTYLRRPMKQVRKRNLRSIKKPWTWTYNCNEIFQLNNKFIRLVFQTVVEYCAIELLWGLHSLFNCVFSINFVLLWFSVSLQSQNCNSKFRLPPKMTVQFFFLQLINAHVAIAYYSNKILYDFFSMYLIQTPTLINPVVVQMSECLFHTQHWTWVM